MTGNLGRSNDAELPVHIQYIREGIDDIKDTLKAQNGRVARLEARASEMEGGIKLSQFYIRIMAMILTGAGSIISILTFVK